jgi:hypothetical protein
MHRARDALRPCLSFLALEDGSEADWALGAGAGSALGPGAGRAPHPHRAALRGRPRAGRPGQTTPPAQPCLSPLPSRPRRAPLPGRSDRLLAARSAARPEGGP